MANNRIHAFDGVRNFRDFGGYTSRHGGYVVPGVLFRSGHYAEASQADLARIGDFRIHLQADLRRPDERENNRARWSAPVTLTHDGGRETEAPHVRFLTEMEVGPAEAESWMVEYYVKAPWKAHHQALFADWFRGLADLPEGAGALVNCAAGKDRTGILCALTHHVLGVSDADIRADYILTNEAAEVEKRLPDMATRFNAHIGRDYDAETYRPFLGVRPHYLETALASIFEKHATLDGYLADCIGVDEAAQNRLRARLIAR